MTPSDLLTTQLRRDSSRPLLTWYDDATGERIELSLATTANWAAKTANLLVGEHGLDPGDRIRLDPPSHWLAVIAALGAWTAGVAVDLTGAGGAAALPGDPAAFMAAVLPQPDALLVAPPAAGDVGVVATQRSWSLGELAAADGQGDATAGCRVLSTLPLDTVEGLRAALLVPLTAGGSVVLVAHPDVERLTTRAATERVTHTAGAALPGLPRLL